MAPRAYWKGYLKLSLVSCPIALYPASSSSERVSFNRINNKTGNRLKQQMVDAETGEPVEKDDIGRGYEIRQGPIPPSSRTTSSTRSRSRARTRSRSTASCRAPRSTTATWTAPTTSRRPTRSGRRPSRSSATPCAKRRWSGSARVVLTRREHVVMLEPFDKGLLATTLRYPYEVRDQADYFEDIPDLKLPDEMKKLAAHIVDTKAGHFDPKTFEDHYEKALVELLKTKQAGEPIETVGEEAARAARHQSDGRAARQHRRQRQEAGGRQHRTAPPPEPAPAPRGQALPRTLIAWTPDTPTTPRRCKRTGRLHRAARLDEAGGGVRAGAPAAAARRGAA